MPRPCEKGTKGWMGGRSVAPTPSPPTHTLTPCPAHHTITPSMKNSARVKLQNIHRAIHVLAACFMALGMAFIFSNKVGGCLWGEGDGRRRIRVYVDGGNEGRVDALLTRWLGPGPGLRVSFDGKGGRGGGPGDGRSTGGLAFSGPTTTLHQIKQWHFR